MDFGDVLSRAWQITWKHKILWLFGIFASCGGTNGFGGPGGDPGVEYQFQGQDVPLPPMLQALLERINQAMGQIPEEQWILIAIAAACLGFIISVAVLLLRTFGKTGLIIGAIQGEQGASEVSFRGVFEAVKPLYLRMLGLNLLIFAAILVIAIAVAAMLALFVGITFGFGVLCVIPLICLLIPVAWIAGIVIEQGQIALVVENLDVFRALERGWEVVRQNLGTMILMSLILFVGVGIIAGGILGLPILLIVTPAIVNAIAGNQEALGNSLVLALGCFILYLPVLIVAQGVLQTFIESSWTLTFLRLTEPPARPQTVEPILAS